MQPIGLRAARLPWAFSYFSNSTRGRPRESPLPTQGPIAVFVHHNTLHALEDHRFAEAAREGAKVFGAQPYFSEARYRQELKNGRIKSTDLEFVLRDELGPDADVEVVSGQTRFDLRLRMLLAPIRTGPSAELSWLVAETDALRTFRREVCPPPKQLA